MVKQALGLIETFGLAAAIAAADAAVKSANVQLVGYELTRGGGLTTVKLFGDVGAVKAAVDAGKMAAEKVNKVWSTHVIPRPHEELSPLLLNQETVGYDKSADVSAAAAVKNVPPEEKQQDIDIKEEIDKEVNKGVKEQVIAEPEKIKPPVESQAKPVKSPDEICNLCLDPACGRRKGEPRVNCIHYEKLNNKEES